MTESEQQSLINLCEDPNNYVELVENWANKTKSDPCLVKELFTKHHLMNRIKDYRIIKDKIHLGPMVCEPVMVQFQLKSDNQWYSLFGMLDEDDKVHVVLSRRETPEDLPN